MRVLVEVLADDREDAVALLRAAAADLRKGKEVSGHTEHSCLGDYRVVVTEEVDPDPPFERGDVVECTDRTSVYYGSTGVVRHSGPRASGVDYPQPRGFVETIVKPNADWRRAECRAAKEGRKGPCDCMVCQPPRHPAPKPEVLEATKGVAERVDRTLGTAPLIFAVGDEVRLRVELEVAPSGVLPPGTVGKIEDVSDFNGTYLVLFAGSGWAWLSRDDLDLVGLR